MQAEKNVVKSAPQVFGPDYRDMISESDICFNGKIPFGPHGMPVANGRFGGPVWQNGIHTLVMQLNHADAFMFNDASAVSETRRNSGGGALGRIAIGFGKGGVFNDPQYRLSLYDGRLKITGCGVEIEATADMRRDAVVFQITDSRPSPTAIFIDLVMLRDAVQAWGSHTAASFFHISEDKKAVTLEQRITEKCDSGIKANDYFCSTAVSLTVHGRDAAHIMDSMAGVRNAKRLILPAQTGAFTVSVGGASSMDETIDVKANALSNAFSSDDYEEVSSAARKWWADFWSKSYIRLPSQPEYEKRRNYFLYLSAISNRGAFPSKYNGGVWIAEEDRRDWGSFYWNWNQDPQYQPLAEANHLELLDPLFRMRESCYEQYKTAARQLWGAGGVFIPETCGILGWETLPDDVADDLRAFYTTETAPCTNRLQEFAKNRNSYLIPWNWKISIGGKDRRTGWVTHSLVATQETAEYYWQRYRYTKDICWLRDRAYPFIKGAAELYRTYPGFVKEGDGKYHFNRTHLHEHIWAGRDVIDDLSLARGIFAVAVEASKLLGVDEDMRPLWEDCRDHLADYPLRTDPEAYYGASDYPSLATGKPAWSQGKGPASFTRAMGGTESPILKMLERFDVLNLETRDQGLDGGDFEIALNTYRHSPGYYNQVINQIPDRSGSSRFHKDAAMLGRAEDMEKILSAQYGAFTTHGENPNMLFDQGDYYSLEGYGTFAAAIQAALHQSISPSPAADPVMRVFPAWPKKWDAKFKLLAKGGFLVSSSIESGEILYVKIISQLGGVCRIRNPWAANVALYRNGVFAEAITAAENDLLSFATEKNETIILAKSD